MVVRTLIPSHFKAPWGFAKKGAKGLRKIGPLHYESWKWPGQNREFPELTPKWQKDNRMELRRYTGVQPTGYDDPNTGKFVHLPEMIPELIVPDLTGFPLRPYVSYRTDIEIEKRIANTDKILAKNPKNPPIDKIWPPPPVDAKLLFDCFYADEIKKKYFETTTEKKKKSGFFASLIKKN